MRSLGVALQRIEVDGRMLDLGALRGGWHPLEAETGRKWRWTDGMALLPGEARRISAKICSDSLYWVEAEPSRRARRLAAG
jgi:hypothetical protein